MSTEGNLEDIGFNPPPIYDNELTKKYSGSLEKNARRKKYEENIIQETINKALKSVAPDKSDFDLYCKYVTDKYENHIDENGGKKETKTRESL